MTEQPPRVTRAFIVVAAACALLAPAAGSGPLPPVSASRQAAPTAAAGFTAEEVAPGVHALIRTKPLGFLNDCNVVFIINDEDVVVVDSNLTPASAEASVTALRRLTSKPVRFVINTHWHVDHVSGNQVYLRHFPGVEFIGHRQVREDLVAKGAANRREMGEQGRQFAESMRQRVAEGKSLTGAAISEAERTSYAADLALIDELVAAIPSIQVVPPTVVVDERLRLIRGRRTIDVVRLGRSHTHGDLAVVLPDEGVVVTGDLLSGPIPIVGGDQSFVGDWIDSLDRLLELPSRILVPGHGPVFRDHAQARLLRDFLKAVDAHASDAIARGLSLDDARKTLDVEAFRTAMAGTDQALRVLFSNYGTGPALAAAFRDGARSRPVQPSVALPPDLDRVLRDYERAWQARDALALATLFAEDGFVLSNGRPAVRGRAAIRDHYAGTGGPLALRAVASAVDGSVGYIVGAYARASGAPDIGKFVLALRRTADGRWLIAADIDNSVRD